MKTTVDGIMKSRMLFNCGPSGMEVSKEEFDDILKSYPRATTYNYADATV